MSIKFYVFAAMLALSFAFTSFAQKKPTPAPVKPKIVAKGLLNGNAIELPKPAYPEAALAAGASGLVKVQVTINEQGNVISAKAVSGPELLYDAAVLAARQAKFTPTTLRGQPVKVAGTIVYNFKPANYEQETRLMALGLIFTFPELLDYADDDEAGDADGGGDNGGNGSGETDMGTEIGKEVPSIVREVEPLNHLAGLAKEERYKLIRETGAKAEAKLSGADAWQFSAGKRIAAIMVEFNKMISDDTYMVNEAVLRSELAGIKNSLKTTPSGFPVPVLEKMKALGELADRDDLLSVDSIKELMERTLALIKTVSPD